MDLPIIPFDPKIASREEWRRFHAYRRTRHLEADPDDPDFEDDTVERNLRRGHLQFDVTRLAVLDPAGADAQIGEVYVERSRPGTESHESNRHIAWVGAELVRAHRGRGLARRMLAEIVEIARSHDRTILQSWCEEDAGKAFAAAIGAKVVQRRRQNRLKFEDVDWSMVERWAMEGPRRAPGTALRWFVNRIDDDVLAPYCTLYTHVFNQQPFGKAEHGEFVFTPEVFREREARVADERSTWITAITVEPNGDLSGLTEMTHVPDSKWIIFQQLTGVRDTYRGRGLGKWLKAEMLLRVRREFPGVRVVTTGNASANVPMLSINERLGFRTHREPVVVEMTRDALESYLRDRGG